MNKAVWRALVEMGFIIFLFYSNLLMGEYNRSGAASTKGLSWALRDIFTAPNFAVAIGAAMVGYFVVEALRNRL